MYKNQRLNNIYNPDRKDYRNQKLLQLTFQNAKTNINFPKTSSPVWREERSAKKLPPFHQCNTQKPKQVTTDKLWWSSHWHRKYLIASRIFYSVVKYLNNFFVTKWFLFHSPLFTAPDDCLFSYIQNIDQLKVAPRLLQHTCFDIKSLKKP